MFFKNCANKLCGKIYLVGTAIQYFALGLVDRLATCPAGWQHSEKVIAGLLVDVTFITEGLDSLLYTYFFQLLQLIVFYIFDI